MSDPALSSIASGPIAITGASGHIGTRLRERLAGVVEVVPLGRGDDWDTAIRSAAAVAHLAGTLRPGRGDDYESANVATTRAVARAAGAPGSRVKRVAFLSYVGASPAAGNAYLRAKGQAEQILLDTTIAVTVFRCLHVFGDPARPGPTAAALLKPRIGPVLVPGSGRQRIAPVYAGDVVEALVRALAGPPDAPTGVFELAGPESMPVDRLVRILNGGDVPIMHLPEPLARLLARAVSSLTPTLIEMLTADNIASGAPSATAALDLRRRRMEEVWSSPGGPTGVA